MLVDAPPCLLSGSSPEAFTTDTVGPLTGNALENATEVGAIATAIISAVGMISRAVADKNGRMVFIAVLAVAIVAVHHLPENAPRAGS